MKTGRAPIALVFMGSLIFAQRPESAPQATVLKADTSEVVVDTIVTDRKGRHVHGLTAGDFRVYEDGQLQQISSFSAAGSAPVTALESAPDRVGNIPATSPPGSAKPTAALLTFVIDLGDLHSDSLVRACSAASRFVAKARDPRTQFAIYSVDTGFHLVLPFSPDRQAVLNALNRLKSQAPYGKLSVAGRQSILDEMASPSKITDPVLDVHVRSMMKTWYVTLNSLQAKTVFLALRAIALAYRDLPGRKNVILFSEGFPHAHDGSAAIQSVVDAANRANMAIYVVDAAGLTLTGAANQNGALPTEKPDFAAGGMNQFDWIQTIGTEVHGDLGVLATYTGGFLVHDTNNLDAALSRVADDADDFYTLVYHPARRTFDGSFRKITVELKAKGLRVRHRRGYWAMPPGREIMMTPAAAQFLASIQSGERKPSFVPQVNAALVPDPGGGFGVSAAVALPGKLFRFTRTNDQYVSGLNVLLIVQDVHGQVLGVHERYGDVKLDRQGWREFSASGFNWQGHVVVPELQPVKIRAYVQFADGTLGASELQDVGLPGGSSDLRLTSLVLSRRGDTKPCLRSDRDPLCVQGVRMLLPAKAVFPRSSSLLVYFSVLGLALTAENKPNLGISFRLHSGNGENSLQPKNFVTVGEPAPRSVGILAEFDLANLLPGQYTLEAAVRDKIAQTQAASDAKLTVQ